MKIEKKKKKNRINKIEGQGERKNGDTHGSYGESNRV